MKAIWPGPARRHKWLEADCYRGRGCWLRLGLSTRVRALFVKNPRTTLQTSGIGRSSRYSRNTDRQMGKRGAGQSASPQNSAGRSGKVFRFPSATT